MHDHYRRLIARVTLRECERMTHAIEEQLTVRQIGESVMECVMRKRVFRPLAFRDIAVYHHETLSLAVAVLNRASRRFEDAPSAVIVPYAVLESFSASC